MASQDDECRLLQVGSWSAKTGYGLAFPTHSKFKGMFNDKILELRENGDLERLGRFWLSGMCKPNVQEKRASEPLSIAQFLSAFLLLGIGTGISVFFLTVEHLYMRYLQGHVDRKNETAKGCFSLLSRSIGQSYLKSWKYKAASPSDEMPGAFENHAENHVGNHASDNIVKFLERRRNCQNETVCTAKEIASAKMPFFRSETFSGIGSATLFIAQHDPD